MAVRIVAETKKAVIDKMSNLCDKCGRGKHTLDIDSRSPICPYLFCHDGVYCSMHTELIDKIPFKKVKTTLK